MKNLIIISLFLFSGLSHSKEVEGFFGASYTTFDEVDGYDTAGASARIKYNMYNSGKGFFLYSNFKGQSIVNFDALLGYGIRSSGKWYFEAGAGGFYSFYFGPGLGVLLSTGIEFDSKWFMSLPLVIRSGGLGYLQISPMIGWRF